MNSLYIQNYFFYPQYFNAICKGRIFKWTLYIPHIMIMISEQHFQSINNLHSPLNQPSFPNKLLINKYGFRSIQLNGSNK